MWNFESDDSDSEVKLTKHYSLFKNYFTHPVLKLRPYLFSPPVDFIFYLTNRTKIPQYFLNIVWLIICIQLCLTSFFPLIANNDYSSKSLTFLKIMQQIFLVYGSENSTPFFIRFILYYNIVIFMIEWILIFLYIFKSCLNPFICYVYLFFDIILCVIFTPLSAYYIGLGFEYFIQSDNYSFSYLIITIFAFLLQFRALVTFVTTHNYLALSYHVHKNYTYTVYFFYITIISSFTTFVYNHIDNVYIFCILSFASFVFTLFYYYRPHIYQKFQSVTVNATACFNFTMLLICGFGRNFFPPQLIIWGSLLVFLIYASIFYFLFDVHTAQAIKMITKPNFTEKMKSGIQVMHYMGYASQFGSIEMLECTHLIPLYQKFKNDNNFQFALAVCSCSYRQFPDELEPHVIPFNSFSAYNNTYSLFVEEFQRLKGPRTPEEMIRHNIHASLIEDSLKKLVKMFYKMTDIIFHETSNVLTVNAVTTYKEFSNLQMLLLRFLQKYPKSPLAKVYAEVFSNLIINKDLQNEIKFWTKYKYGIPLANPKLETIVALEARDPLVEAFHPKYAEFPQNLVNISKTTFSNLKSFQMKQPPSPKKNGPYMVSLRNFPFLFAYLILLFAPFAFFHIIAIENISYQTTANDIRKALLITQNLSLIAAYSPIYAEMDGAEFTYLLDEFADEMFDLTISTYKSTLDFVNYVSQMNKNTILPIDMYFQERMANFFLTTTNIIQGTIDTDYSQRELIGSILFDVLEASLSAVSKRPIARVTDFPLSESFVNFSDHFIIAIQNAGQKEHPLFEFSIYYYLIIIFAGILFCLTLICLEFYRSKQRMNDYYTALNHVSKAGLNKLKDYYANTSSSLSELDNYFRSFKKQYRNESKDQIYSFAFIRLVFIPCIIFLIVGTTLLTVTYGIFQCRTKSTLNQIELLNFLTRFILNYSKAVSATHNYFFNANFQLDPEKLYNEATNAISQIFNDSYTQYRSSQFCNLCIPQYTKMFKSTIDNDVETVFNLYLTNIVNFVTTETVFTSSGTNKVKMARLFHYNVKEAFQYVTIRMLNETIEEIDHAIPWFQVTFFLYIFVLILFFISNLYAFSIGDVPYSILSSIVSLLDAVEQMGQQNLMIVENKEYPRQKELTSLDYHIFNDLRKSINSAIIIIDYQLNIVSYNEECCHLFVGEQLLEKNISIYEALKSTYIDVKTQIPLKHIINQYLYGEINIVTSYTIADTGDRNETYDLLCIPLYTDNKSPINGQNMTSPHLILSFTENYQAFKLSSLIESNKKIPGLILRDWMHNKIAEPFSQNHNYPLIFIENGLVAVMHLTGLTNLGNGQLDQTINNIDQIYRRFDMIVASHKMLTKFRTHSSLYCIGTDVFEPPKINHIITLDFLRCIQELLDEATRLSISKGVEIEAKVSATLGQITAGLPGPPHPWFEFWGNAATEAFTNLLFAAPNVITVTDEVLETTKEIDAFFDIQTNQHLHYLQKLMNPDSMKKKRLSKQINE